MPVFFTHTHYVYKHEADSSKIPFHWGMSTASPDLHALTQDDEEWSETSR